MKNLLLAFVCALFSIQANAAFQIERQHAFTDTVTGITDFSITFTETPDFETVDEYGRHANAFQYYIYGDLSLPYDDYFSSIIRGPEINVIDLTLPVRDPSTDGLPGCQEPGSGGWGCISFEIPYTLTGSTLAFSAATNDLTAFTNANGSITYDILLVEYGATSDRRVGLVSAVPLPASFWLFGSALIGLAGIKRKK